MTKTIQTPAFLTFTISIVVFFAGAGLNRWIAPLRRWNIPEAVTVFSVGGSLFDFNPPFSSLASLPQA